MNDQHLLRYSRHILLEEIGIEGQERLLRSNALIIGMGGLGSPAALYLAASGVGKLTLCDHDTVDFSNLQRQIIHRTATVGQPKVASAKVALHEINPEVECVALETRVSELEAGARERIDAERFVDWYVVVAGAAQLSVGCEAGRSAAPLAGACERAVGTVREE